MIMCVNNNKISRVSMLVMVIISSILSLASCKKEERINRNSTLILDFRDKSCRQNTDMYLSVMNKSGKVVISEYIHLERLSDSVLVYKVPDGVLTCSVVAGDDGLADDRGAVKIPLGKPCPPLYAWKRDIKCIAGSKSVSQVFMHKEHTVLRLRINSTTCGSVNSAVVVGDVDGLGYDGSCSKGDFYVSCDIKDRELQLVLPRQDDPSLYMEIRDREGALRRFALGNYIYESGYDWQGLELEDIDINLDLVSSKIIMSYADIVEEKSFEIII